MIARLAPLAFALLLLGGCAKKEPPPAEAPPEPPPAATVAAPTPPPSAASTDSDLPTEEDFEEEADKEVTAANLDAQLDALEKEINAD